jgi:hypothetical protein
VRTKFGAVLLVVIILLAGCSTLSPSDETPEFVPSNTADQEDPTPSNTVDQEDPTPFVPSAEVTTDAPPPSSFNASAFRQTMATEFNDARDMADMPPLEYREDWESVANSVAEDLANEQAIRNNLLDTRTFNVTNRLETAGKTCSIQANGYTYRAGSYYAYNWMYTQVNTTDGVRYFTSEVELAKHMTNSQMLSDLNETERDEVREVVYREFSEYHTVGIHVDEKFRVWVTYIVC